ncbi:TIGR03619 family F420-dependent LLM class oxidoreductase [Amycolatopsis sp. YIM 10]|uniref:TIGR03619 family F420-dependent LLM class oxidoreductase n=1 Tax=Amycolatopsis sp. YIM 10 TaxID=2653857 RepID=UPI00129049C6|nr:TIGR03619 family F420-dependent LLM class oxidoreductase [Amycolatopsis sp. YIM 10]QFU88297.1 Phthiodiolone/phenolphthiodiolone dimycocerosates ketoreductase [Amycolatopsis sp. YIM 10]
MRIGFSLPQYGAMAHELDRLADFARQAEELGADSLWVGDRVLAAVDPSVGYMGTDTIPWQLHTMLDPFVALSVASSVTERALLGTSALVAPWYHPLLLARSLTGVDVVSGGRLIPGLGTGWSPEEYEGVGVPWKERGARLDECLDVLEAVWTTEPVAHHDGTHYAYPAAHIGPKPVQHPRPPLYLSGFALAARRRAARRADGILPVEVLVPGSAFDPAAVINQPLREVRRIAEAEGRDPARIDAILRINPDSESTVREIADVILRTGDETDVDHVFVDFVYLAGQGVGQALELVRRTLELTR